MKKRTTLWILPLILSGMVLLFAGSCTKSDDSTNNTTGNTVTDIDGNVYSTVTIGTQVWMASNLKTTKYRDGSPIPLVTDSLGWHNLTSGAYCDYNNDPTNSATYGRLYNSYAVSDSRNIAPAGWHVPTHVEWTVLSDFLGGETLAGGKLKETGTAHWQTPNTVATNESGFTAYPGGMRHSSDGSFSGIFTNGFWWTITTDINSTAYMRGLNYNDGGLGHALYDRTPGFSLRCVKD
jgi:uncharacterized protein (TIGR02145 family)